MSELLGNSILEICYLIASITFILGLKMLSSPDKARKGNLYAAYGMGLAIVATILFKEELSADKTLNYVLRANSGHRHRYAYGTESEDDGHAANGLLLQWYGRCLCCRDFHSRI